MRIKDIIVGNYYACGMGSGRSASKTPWDIDKVVILETGVEGTYRGKEKKDLVRVSRHERIEPFLVTTRHIEMPWDKYEEYAKLRDEKKIADSSKTYQQGLSIYRELSSRGLVTAPLGICFCIKNEKASSTCFSCYGTGVTIPRGAVSPWGRSVTLSFDEIQELMKI